MVSKCKKKEKNEFFITFSPQPLAIAVKGFANCISKKN